MMLKSIISFPLTVPNRTSNGGIDFSLKSPEFSHCIMCVQYVGECSVHCGVLSTLGDTMSTLGDIMSISGSV